MKSKVYQPQVFRCGVVANLPPIVRRFGTALQVRAQDFDADEAITSNWITSLCTILREICIIIEGIVIDVVSDCGGRLNTGHGGSRESQSAIEFDGN